MTIYTTPTVVQQQIFIDDMTSLEQMVLMKMFQYEVIGSGLQSSDRLFFYTTNALIALL